MVLLLEPVLNPLWAWWLHGETITRWAVGGGAVVLGAILHRSWTEGNQRSA